MTSASSRICAGRWFCMFTDCLRYAKPTRMGRAAISKVNSCRDLTKNDFDKYKSWVRFTPLKGYDLRYPPTLYLHVTALYQVVSINQICGTSWLDPQQSTVRHIFCFSHPSLVGKENVVLNPKVFGAWNLAQSNPCVSVGFIPMNTIYVYVKFIHQNPSKSPSSSGWITSSFPSFPSFPPGLHRSSCSPWAKGHSVPLA